MAIPTSAFPNPVYAPRPTYPGTDLEPFPAIRISAITFTTPQIATDLQYSFACGQLTQWLVQQGLDPISGPWEQAWVTYSKESPSPHVNECWIEVAAP
jgi:hypothetical protein